MKVRPGLMAPSRRSSILLLAAIMAAAGPLGCAVPRRSTRLTADDFQQMANDMAASIAAENTIAARSPNSPPWIITISRITNLTGDVLTESEQWGTIAMLRQQLPLQTLARQKHVVFVIPAERVAALRQNPDLSEIDRPFAAQRRPTHTMTAVFRSVTRADATHRSDLYTCEFEILDLRTAEPVWTDRFEFKRLAMGHIWD